MKDQEANPWKKLHSEIVYTNPWIDVLHQDVINPSGNKGIYGVVHFKNLAVGVIPLDEDYNTWIVGQYRYTVKTYSWEIPEGGCMMGTDPIEAAKRELKEETGIIAEDWSQLLEMHTSNSVCDEHAIIYIAKKLSFGPSDPEDTEQLQVKKLPFEELFQMTMKGHITDSMSVAAILKTKHLIDNSTI